MSDYEEQQRRIKSGGYNPDNLKKKKKSLEGAIEQENSQSE